MRSAPSALRGLFASSLPVLAAVIVTIAAPAPVAAARDEAREAWLDMVRRAQVWRPGDVAAKDLAAGPKEPGAFPLGATVECTWVRRELGGATPKFTCRLPDGDEVKVKYGRENGEVYAEVAASRLLWALGFGADRVYPVRVRCHGCPVE